MLLAPPALIGATTPAAGGAMGGDLATGFEALLAALFAPVTPGAAALVGARASDPKDPGSTDDQGQTDPMAGLQVAFGQLFVAQPPPPVADPTSGQTGVAVDGASAVIAATGTAPPVAIASSLTLAGTETPAAPTQAAPTPPPEPPAPHAELTPPTQVLASQAATAAAPGLSESAGRAASAAAPPAPTNRSGPTRWSGASAAASPGVTAAQSTTAAAPPPTPSPAPGLLVAAQAHFADPAPTDLAAPNGGDSPQPQSLAGPSGAAPQLPTGLGAPAQPVRANLETIATLAAQILKKLDDRSTRFDMELEPAGLGRVDVRLEVGAHGRITAAMSFDNPHAAAEMKNRAGELTRALEQAGFDVSGGLSFDLAGDQGQAGGKGAAQDQSGSPRAGRAFQAVLDGAAGPELAASGPVRGRWSAAGNVDITI